MKLNKYIYKRLAESFEKNEYDWIGKRSTVITEEDIDDWIADWYNDTFPNFRDNTKPRGPPMWLCGPRWYDRRKRMIKEAEKIKAAEEKSNDE
jgi:hypothetical protein